MKEEDKAEEEITTPERKTETKTGEETPTEGYLVIRQRDVSLRQRDV